MACFTPTPDQLSQLPWKTVILGRFARMSGGSTVFSQFH